MDVGLCRIRKHRVVLGEEPQGRVGRTKHEAVDLLVGLALIVDQGEVQECLSTLLEVLLQGPYIADSPQCGKCFGCGSLSEASFDT